MPCRGHPKLFENGWEIPCFFVCGRRKRGRPYLVVGLSEDSFISLTPEQVQKYTEHFKQPEQFINLNGQIIALPVEPENPLRTAEMTLGRTTMG